MKSFRRILFATDFSEGARKAFDEAVDLARNNEAELLIANAYLPPSFLPLDIYMSAATFQEVDSRAQEGVSLKLKELVETARQKGVNARPLVLSGIPSEAIAEAAATQRADVVVMGTHGRTGAARLFLGSVASRVISTAPCPVLTVRAAA